MVYFILFIYIVCSFPIDALSPASHVQLLQNQMFPQEAQTLPTLGLQTANRFNQTYKEVFNVSCINPEDKTYKEALTTFTQKLLEREQKTGCDYDGNLVIQQIIDQLLQQLSSGKNLNLPKAKKKRSGVDKKKSRTLSWDDFKGNYDGSSGSLTTKVSPSSDHLSFFQKRRTSPPRSEVSPPFTRRQTSIGSQTFSSSSLPISIPQASDYSYPSSFPTAYPESTSSSYSTSPPSLNTSTSLSLSHRSDFFELKDTPSEQDELQDFLLGEHQIEQLNMTTTDMIIKDPSLPDLTLSNYCHKQFHFLVSDSLIQSFQYFALKKYRTDSHDWKLIDLITRLIQSQITIQEFALQVTQEIPEAQQIAYDSLKDTSINNSVALSFSKHIISQLAQGLSNFHSIWMCQLRVYPSPWTPFKTYSLSNIPEEEYTSRPPSFNKMTFSQIAHFQILSGIEKNIDAIFSQETFDLNLLKELWEQKINFIQIPPLVFRLLKETSDSSLKETHSPKTKLNYTEVYLSPLQSLYCPSLTLKNIYSFEPLSPLKEECSKLIKQSIQPQSFSQLPSPSFTPIVDRFFDNLLQEDLKNNSHQFLDLIIFIHSKMGNNKFTSLPIYSLPLPLFNLIKHIDLIPFLSQYKCSTQLIEKNSFEFLASYFTYLIHLKKETLDKNDLLKALEHAYIHNHSSACSFFENIHLLHPKLSEIDNKNIQSYFHFLNSLHLGKETYLHIYYDSSSPEKKLTFSPNRLVESCQFILHYFQPLNSLSQSQSNTSNSFKWKQLSSHISCLFDSQSSLAQRLKSLTYVTSTLTDTPFNLFLNTDSSDNLIPFLFQSSEKKEFHLIQTTSIYSLFDILTYSHPSDFIAWELLNNRLLPFQKTSPYPSLEFLDLARNNQAFIDFSNPDAPYYSLLTQTLPAWTPSCSLKDKEKELSSLIIQMKDDYTLFEEGISQMTLFKNSIYQLKQYLPSKYSDLITSYITTNKLDSSSQNKSLFMILSLINNTQKPSQLTIDTLQQTQQHIDFILKVLNTFPLFASAFSVAPCEVLHFIFSYIDMIPQFYTNSSYHDHYLHALPFLIRSLITQDSRSIFSRSLWSYYYRYYPRSLPPSFQSFSNSFSTLFQTLKSLSSHPFDCFYSRDFIHACQPPHSSSERTSSPPLINFDQSYRFLKLHISTLYFNDDVYLQISPDTTNLFVYIQTVLFFSLPLNRLHAHHLDCRKSTFVAIAFLFIAIIFSAYVAFPLTSFSLPPSIPSIQSPSSSDPQSFPSSSHTVSPSSPDSSSRTQPTKDSSEFVNSPDLTTFFPATPHPPVSIESLIPNFSPVTPQKQPRNYAKQDLKLKSEYCQKGSQKVSSLSHLIQRHYCPQLTSLVSDYSFSPPSAPFDIFYLQRSAFHYFFYSNDDTYQTQLSDNFDQQLTLFRKQAGQNKKLLTLLSEYEKLFSLTKTVLYKPTSSEKYQTRERLTVTAQAIQELLLAVNNRLSHLASLTPIRVKDPLENIFHSAIIYYLIYDFQILFKAELSSNDFVDLNRLTFKPIDSSGSFHLEIASLLRNSYPPMLRDFFSRYIHSLINLKKIGDNIVDIILEANDVDSLLMNLKNSRKRNFDTIANLDSFNTPAMSETPPPTFVSTVSCFQLIDRMYLNDLDILHFVFSDSFLTKKNIAVATATFSALYYDTYAQYPSYLSSFSEIWSLDPNDRTCFPLLVFWRINEAYWRTQMITALQEASTKTSQKMRSFQNFMRPSDLTYQPQSLIQFTLSPSKHVIHNICLLNSISYSLTLEQIEGLISFPITFIHTFGGSFSFSTDFLEEGEEIFENSFSLIPFKQRLQSCPQSILYSTRTNNDNCQIELSYLKQNFKDDMNGFYSPLIPSIEGLLSAQETPSDSSKAPFVYQALPLFLHSQASPAKQYIFETSLHAIHQELFPPTLTPTQFPLFFHKVSSRLCTLIKKCSKQTLPSSKKEELDLLITEVLYNYFKYFFKHSFIFNTLSQAKKQENPSLFLTQNLAHLPSNSFILPYTNKDKKVLKYLIEKSSSHLNFLIQHVSSGPIVQTLPLKFKKNASPLHKQQSRYVHSHLLRSA